MWVNQYRWYYDQHLLPVRTLAPFLILGKMRKREISGERSVERRSTARAARSLACAIHQGLRLRVQCRKLHESENENETIRNELAQIVRAPLCAQRTAAGSAEAPVVELADQ